MIWRPRLHTVKVYDFRQASDEPQYHEYAFSSPVPSFLYEDLTLDFSEFM